MHLAKSSAKDTSAQSEYQTSSNNNLQSDPVSPYNADSFGQLIVILESWWHSEGMT